ncbi:uncharacterized protein METZ01_LOCUS293383, partial [marine metagenome]
VLDSGCGVYDAQNRISSLNTMIFGLQTPPPWH